MAKFKMEGMKELQKSIKKLGEVPQKCVTPAAKKGMNIALKAAKPLTPVEEGNLKKGLKLKGEKSRLKGKKVYQVTFSSSMNDIFVKVSKDGKRSYYPASQEYGYFAKNGRYIPGFHFLKKSLSNNSSSITKKIIYEMSKNIDKALEGK